MQRLILFFLTISLLFGGQAEAQKLLQPMDGFSKKKPAYITLKRDGKEKEYTIQNIKRKKGLIKEIIVKDKKKKKLTIMPEDVSNMFLPESGFNKFGREWGNAFDAQTWGDDGLQAEKRFKDGYAYFEYTEVMVKKKKRPLLMQLLNPSFSSKIRIYHDPLAKETMAPSVGGITVAGGDDKSLYVKKGDKTAVRIKKKNYDKEFSNLYGDCKSFMKKNKPKWKEFAKQVHAYTFKHCVAGEKGGEKDKMKAPKKTKKTEKADH